MVTVTSAAQSAPTVFPLAPCGSGGSDMVTLGCLASGFTPSSITFSWKEGSNSLENIIQYPSMQKGNEYIGIAQVQVSRQDWDARKSFKCVANHAAGERFAIITKPNELFETPTLKVCSSVEEGKDEAYFSCFAKDFSPNTYQIKWLKDDEEITGKIDEVATLSHGRKDENGTLYSVASLLTLPLNDVTEESKIKCLFTGKGDRNTVVQRNATASLKQCTAVSEGCVEADVDISIIPPSNQDLLTKGKGTLICQVAVKKGTPERIAWEDEKKRELVSERLTGSSRTNKVEIEITYSEWINGAKRVCVYENKDWFDSVKREYKRNNGGVPKRPAVFMLPPVEQTREDTVVLTCYVKDFYPQEIYVAWLVDDDEVGTKYPSSTTEPVKNNGLFSVYSQMILPKDTWEQMDMVFSCAVYHESLANATRSIVRSIGFRTFDKTNVVNLSMNVPETCKA